MRAIRVRDGMVVSAGDILSGNDRPQGQAEVYQNYWGPVRPGQIDPTWSTHGGGPDLSGKSPRRLLITSGLSLHIEDCGRSLDDSDLDSLCFLVYPSIGSPFIPDYITRARAPGSNSYSLVAKNPVTLELLDLLSDVRSIYVLNYDEHK